MRYNVLIIDKNKISLEYSNKVLLNQNANQTNVLNLEKKQIQEMKPIANVIFDHLNNE